MVKAAAGNQFFTKVGEVQKTVTLPAFNGTPIELDATREMVAEFFIQSRANFRWCRAASIAEAQVSLLDENLFFLADKGAYNFPVSANNDEKLYFVADVGSLARGFSYAELDYGN